MIALILKRVTHFILDLQTGSSPPYQLLHILCGDLDVADPREMASHFAIGVIDPQLLLHKILPGYSARRYCQDNPQGSP